MLLGFNIFGGINTFYKIVEGGRGRVSDKIKQQQGGCKIIGDSQMFVPSTSSNGLFLIYTTHIDILCQMMFSLL